VVQLSRCSGSPWGETPTQASSTKSGAVEQDASRIRAAAAEALPSVEQKALPGVLRAVAARFGTAAAAVPPLCSVPRFTPRAAAAVKVAAGCVAAMASPVLAVGWDARLLSGFG
jgi:hypothetical protein